MRSPASGYTLLELLFVVSASATLAAMAVPLASSTIEHVRAAGAARHVAGRIAMARLDAVRKASTVAIRFQPSADEVLLTTVVDGNGNGIRTTDLNRGIDVTTTAPERLGDQFPGARFGLLPDIPDLDGGTGNADGVRIGSTSFLSLAPDGSATSGTLYVQGRRSQFAVRVLGATGRVRLFEYDSGARRWITR